IFPPPPALACSWALSPPPGFPSPWALSPPPAFPCPWALSPPPGFPWPCALSPPPCPFPWAWIAAVVVSARNSAVAESASIRLMRLLSVSSSRVLAAPSRFGQRLCQTVPNSRFYRTGFEIGRAHV